MRNTSGQVEAHNSQEMHPSLLIEAFIIFLLKKLFCLRFAALELLHIDPKALRLKKAFNRNSFGNNTPSTHYTLNGSSFIPVCILHYISTFVCCKYNEAGMDTSDCHAEKTALKNKAVFIS
jgi:hypothetical protein